MNDQPLTRRDVFAFVTRIALASNVLNLVLRVAGQAGLSQLPMFKTSAGLLTSNWIELLMNFALSLALVPFISLIADSVGGRRAGQPIVQSSLFSLLLPCVGLVLFVVALPDVIWSAYAYWQISSLAYVGANTALPYSLQYIASSLIRLSIGFALAFFPAIFDSLRHPDERNAA